MDDSTPAQWFSVHEFGKWGRSFGAALVPPAIVTFTGDLGTGKTTLVRAICDGLGVYEPNAVTSPTYALVHEYETARGHIVHADLYRLRSLAELEDLGWDDLLAKAFVVLVEWPALALPTLPSTAIHIELQHDAARADGRWLRVQR